MQEAFAFRGPSLATGRGMLAAAATSAVSREQWERAWAIVVCAASTAALQVGGWVWRSCGMHVGA